MRRELINRLRVTSKSILLATEFPIFIGSQLDKTQMVPDHCLCRKDILNALSL